MTLLIAPTAELIRQWTADWDTNNGAHCDRDLYIAAMAATWGATTAIEAALKDTAPCHFRVAGGNEDGAQLVRASDLMAWSHKLSERYGFKQ
jgi:hypothetical protein